MDGDDVNRVHPQNIVDGHGGPKGVQATNIVDGQNNPDRGLAEDIVDGHTAMMIDGRSILDEVIFRLLQQEKNTKWKKMNLTGKKFFEDVLSNADNIQKYLTVKELEIVSNVYTLYTI